jgi:hypothetical protein
METDLIALKRRMQAVKVQNFYGSIIREALAAVEKIQDENIALREANCSRRSGLYDVAGQILDAGHMNAEDLARLRAAWEAA